MNILKDRFSTGHHELDWFHSNHLERQQTSKTPVDSSGPVQLICSVPQCVSQGSVLGPQEFIEYTEDIVTTITKFDINHHLYADDSQLLDHFWLEVFIEHFKWLETCVGNLKDWCSSHRLQLNRNKTELIWFGFRANLSKLKRLDVISLTLCSVVIERVDSVRDLGVILDSELSMQKHIDRVSSLCFFHIRPLRPSRQHSKHH